MEIILGAILIVAVVAIVLVPLAILRGYVLSILWGWFIVPIFHLPVLTIPTAIGVAMVIGFLTDKLDTSKKDDSEKSNWNPIIMAYASPLIALLFGWIVTFWL